MGRSVRHVNTISGLRDLPNPGSEGAAHTHGYATSGDGGEGQWYWDAESTHDDDGATVVKPADQAGAGRWLRVTTTPVDPKWFGAKGDGTTDDTGALQAAIDYAFANRATKTPQVRLPPGKYRITTSLKLFSIANGRYEVFGIIIRGDGLNLVYKTEIIADFVDKPAIIIQSARNIQLSGFSITGSANLGEYSWPNYQQLLMDWGPGNNREVPWFLHGIDPITQAVVSSGAIDNRYAPYAGIAIDCFSSQTPAQYRYPGLEAFYDVLSPGGTTSTFGSAVTSLEKLKIQGFIGGVALSTASTVFNNDGVTMRECQFSHNKNSVIVGQSQNKGVSIYDPYVEATRTFINCMDYGSQGAPLPQVVGGTFTHVRWLIRAWGTGNGGSISNIFAESIWSLGYWSAANVGGNRPLLVKGCTFQLYYDYATTSTGNLTNGSATVSNVAASQWTVGGNIFGPGIPDGTTVTAKTSTTLTLSQAATATRTASNLYGNYRHGTENARIFSQGQVDFVGCSLGILNNRFERQNYTNDSRMKFIGCTLDGEPCFTNRALVDFDGCLVTDTAGGNLSHGLSRNYTAPLSTLAAAANSIHAAPYCTIDSGSDADYIRYQSQTGWKDYTIGSCLVTVDPDSQVARFTTPNAWMLQVADYVGTSTPWVLDQKVMQVASISVKEVIDANTLGPELVSNGEFDGTSTGAEAADNKVFGNWRLGPMWTVANGVANKNNYYGATIMTQALALQAGKTYRIVWDVPVLTLGAGEREFADLAKVGFSGGTAVYAPGIRTPGVYTVDLVANAGNTTLEVWALTNVSGITGLSIGRVQEIDGNTVYLYQVPRSFVTGTYTITMDRLPHLRLRTIGTTTSGSADVTGVTPITGWTVGRRISGTGIPEGARITAVSGTTLTLNVAATASGVTELYDAKLMVEHCARTTSPSTSPVLAGTWIAGDYVKNSAPTKDASNMTLLGWVCTGSGAPGTWEPVYGSAISPAFDPGRIGGPS